MKSGRLVMTCSDRRDCLEVTVSEDGARVTGSPFGLGSVVWGVWPLPDGGFLACDSFTVYEIAPGGWVERAISLPCFSDLHAVCAGSAPDSFWVASSGADSVLLCNFSGRVWGSDLSDPQDYLQDYRSRGITSATTHQLHPNSVHPWREGAVFSAFGPCQGGDPPQWNHGWIGGVYCGRLVGGLRCPHDARYDREGNLCYVESETGRVVRGPVQFSDPVFRWAKCALPLGAGMLVGCLDSHLRYVTPAGIQWESRIDGVPFCLEWAGEG